MSGGALVLQIVAWLRLCQQVIDEVTVRNTLSVYGPFWVKLPTHP